MGSKLSIITPVYNGRRFVEFYIKNVIQQKCDNLEHIIVDGMSSDGSLEIIKQYSKEFPHIRWVSEKDKGQSDAMNKGIAMAGGNILGFLNVDDFYEPNVINHVLDIFRSLREPALLVGNCNILDDNENILEINKPRKLDITDLMLGWNINPYPTNPSQYFYHISLHEVIGLYDLEEHYIEDVKTITSSQWLYLQCVHLFTRPRIGNPSVFWTPNIRRTFIQQRIITLISWLHYIKIYDLITRFTDMLGCGDNYLVFLRKT